MTAETSLQNSQETKREMGFQLTGVLRPGLRGGLRVIVGKVDTNNRIGRGSHDRFGGVFNTGSSTSVELFRRLLWGSKSKSSSRIDVCLQVGWMP